jgi:hypothetical protein
MPSPFPGMNPYFEQPDVWRGFRTDFLVELRRAINRVVRPKYRAYLEESVYIDDQATGAFAVADVAVSRRPGRPRGRSAGAAVAAAPVTATLPDWVQRTHRWLTIRDSQDRTVVTVVGLLSPSNKSGGDDGARYRAKRRKVLRSAANLVEIDLLRGGRRMPLDQLPECDYCVVVSRRPDRPRVGLWPVGLREPLPAVPIPLRPGDPEPTVELKPVDPLPRPVVSHPLEPHPG